MQLCKIVHVYLSKQMGQAEGEAKHHLCIRKKKSMKKNSTKDIIIQKYIIFLKIINFHGNVTIGNEEMRYFLRRNNNSSKMRV